jgi:hypothetical protein
MPHLVGLVLIGAGVWAGYKAVLRLSQRATTELRRAEDEMRRKATQAAEKDLGALQLDPETGVYKPTPR